MPQPGDHRGSATRVRRVATDSHQAGRTFRDLGDVDLVREPRDVDRAGRGPMKAIRGRGRHERRGAEGSGAVTAVRPERHEPAAPAVQVQVVRLTGRLRQLREPSTGVDPTDRGPPARWGETDVCRWRGNWRGRRLWSRRRRRRRSRGPRCGREPGRGFRGRARRRRRELARAATADQSHDPEHHDHRRELHVVHRPLPVSMVCAVRQAGRQTRTAAIA